MSEKREPRIADLVVYRSRAGVDMPGIVTALAPVDDDGVQRAVFLELFPPPGEAKDLIDRQWGVAAARGVGEEWYVQRWRWPDDPGA